MIVDTGNNSGTKSFFKVPDSSYVKLTRSNPGKKYTKKLVHLIKTVLLNVRRGTVDWVNSKIREYDC